MTPVRLLIDDAAEPLGVDTPTPAFSWQFDLSGREQRQSAFQVQVATTAAHLEAAADLWDSGRVASDQSSYVAYAGRPLASAAAVFWRVRAWDAAGVAGSWSAIATFGTGLQPRDWIATWIGAGASDELGLPQRLIGSELEAAGTPVQIDPRSLLLRRDLRLDRPLRRAWVFVSGVGYYEMYANGVRLGDAVLNPARTHYHHQVLYDAYDVSDLLRPGDNALGLMLGNGWFNPLRPAWGWRMQWFGAKRAIVQLHLDYADGTAEVLGSDGSWRTSPGPITSSCLYAGEHYDARLEQSGWSEPGFDDAQWTPANCVPAPSGVLRHQDLEPIRVIETRRPVALDQPAPGTWIFDLGQNATGWARITLDGPAGSEVRLRYAESLWPDGRLFTNTHADAAQEDRYTLRGGGREMYEPRFTCHGFRYVEVTGLTATPTLDTLLGCVVHSAVAPTGTFHAGHPLVDHLQHCIRWSQRSNLMGLPTDDCQRAERLGWLGDAHVTAEEAICNFHMPRLYRKWLRDVAVQQDARTGDLPHIAPHHGTDGSPAWSSAGLLVPWYCYQAYGDIRFLRDHYAGMQRYLEHLASTAVDGILPTDRYGDHLSADPGWTSGKPEMTSTWYWLYDARLLARIARVLGENADADRYDALAGRIAEAFNRRFLRRDVAWYDAGSLCEFVMPLYLDLVPAEYRQRLLDGLAYVIETKRGGRMLTGILGAKYTMELLPRLGRSDLAWRLLTQTAFPSWGYMTAGQTTLCEDWSASEGGTLNHVMFGSVGSWLYQILGGITYDASLPADQRLTLAPYLPEGHRGIHASRELPQGRVASLWRRRGSEVAWQVSVPPNLSATLRFPVAAGVCEGGQPIASAAGIHRVELCDGMLQAVVGSGDYAFTWR